MTYLFHKQDCSKKLLGRPYAGDLRTRLEEFERTVLDPLHSEFIATAALLPTAYEVDEKKKVVKPYAEWGTEVIGWAPHNL